MFFNSLGGFKVNGEPTPLFRSESFGRENNQTRSKPSSEPSSWVFFWLPFQKQHSKKQTKPTGRYPKSPGIPSAPSGTFPSWGPPCGPCCQCLRCCPRVDRSCAFGLGNPKTALQWYMEAKTKTRRLALDLAYWATPIYLLELKPFERHQSTAKHVLDTIGSKVECTEFHRWP